MSDSESSSNPKKDEQGKNCEIVYCSYCPSKILNPGAATFINYDFSLPNVAYSPGEDRNAKEAISDYWLIEDINSFENVGVSRKVDNVKYLVCADCERGPIGWHDLATFRSYIALSRVKHSKTKT